MNTVETLGSPFKHLVMTIGELPTTFVESMSYYETIAWLVDYIRKNVIPSINNNAEAIKEIQDWIKTLDLQDEVDNKLEEMAESGELTEIIAQYLQLGAVIAFNTLADMVGSDNLADGSICRILGVTDYKDGDGSYYKIREVINTDVVDGDNLVALTNYPTLVAEKIPHGFIGDLDDLTTEDKDNVVDAINEVNSKRYRGLMTEDYAVYVDSVNGDDDNDGTALYPLKTLNAVFEKYANQKMIMSLKVNMTNGEYDLNCFNLCNVSAHFQHWNKEETAGNRVINIINPAYDDQPTFYNSHLNFSGSNNHPLIINVDSTYAGGFYTDNANIQASYTTFNCRVTLWGSGGRFQHCTLYSLKGRYANFMIEQSNIGYLDITSGNISCWQCNYLTNVDSYMSDYPNILWRLGCSNMLISGASTMECATTPDIENLCEITGGSISLRAGLSEKNSQTIAPFTGHNGFYGCLITATQARFNAIKAFATTTDVDTDCVVTSGVS